MVDLANYRDKLSEKAQRVLSAAVEESTRRQHYYLGVEHIFLAFTAVERSLFEATMQELGVGAAEVVQLLKDNLEVSRQYLGGGMKISPDTRALFRTAWERVQNAGRSVITSTDIFIAIFQDARCAPVQILRQLGVEPAQALEEISIQIRKREEQEKELRRKFELPPYLKQFGVNLNKLARMERLPVLVGRDAELDQAMEILCHRERPNSVLIIGEAGVGKTALVEGLARRIELDPENVPERLRDRQVVHVQMNALVAGTMFRGMFEDRVEKVLKELRERQNIILFIDEAHSIIGAGSAMGVPSDAANIFKNALSRGEIQIIGATTAGEYKEFIAEDEALARRFRVVHLKEPTVEETLRILQGVREHLGLLYGVRVTDEAIQTALSMSRRYQRSHKLPDKVINWLDTACVKVEIHRPHGEVQADDVMRVISQESQVPLDMVFRETAQRFAPMEEALSHRVVGQHEAIEALARRLRLNKGPLKENFNRPDGVLLFLGPTGVGKTELAKSLAEFLYGDEHKMIRLDMSEYRDGTLGVDKLIGMPRGIVGSERGGLLSNAMRDNPCSVVLLDEIEKASPQVLTLFLQVFDEGWLTDGRGKRVYFSDSVILMTSNLGSDEFRRFSQPLGFLEEGANVAALQKSVIREVEVNFSPEFINRIDEVVVFAPLSRGEVKEISRRYLETLKETLEENGKTLEWTDAALEAIVQVGFSLKYGARFLKRKIDERVKIPITMHWREGNHFTVDAVEEDIRVRWAPSAVAEPVLV